VGLIAQLTALAILVSLWFPAARRALAEPDFLTLCVEILAVAGLTGYGIYHLATRATRASRMKTINENPFTSSDTVPDRTWSGAEPDGIPDFLYPMLRRRYPWRH